MATSVFQKKINSIRALHDHIIVRDMNFGERKLSSGIFLASDDSRSEGIRPRWAKVYVVGPDQNEIKPNQWVYVEHGRWTRGVDVEIDGDSFTIRRVDNDCILLVSDEEPQSDDTISDKI